MLERIQRIALARILSDLIEADFIVEEREMDFFEKIISKDGFNISKAMLVEAKKIDFAKALSILKELDEKGRARIVESLKKLSLSDGMCVPLEAILIYSVISALTEQGRVYSVPSDGIRIDNMTAIYVENSNGTETNSAIEENYHVLCRSLEHAGFEFVYIPNVVRDFQRMGDCYLEKVVRYMIPSASSDKVDEICDSLCNMTTARFCQDLLYKKIGTNLIDSQPSLLIKINESDTINTNGDDDTERIRFSNFLQIELANNAVGMVQKMVDTYKGFINCEIRERHRLKSDKFVYFGFHRSLFDLIAYGKKQQEYILVFDFSRKTANIFFESLDGKSKVVLKLNPQEATLYMMIAKKSMEKEGLDWREHIPTKEKIDLLREYNQYYRCVGKGNVVKGYKDRTQTHHIKTKIRLLNCLANMDMFVPECVRHDNLSFYRIRAPKRFVKFVLPQEMQTSTL